eukprot:8445876-Karenia_brevis.AAC.1
MASWSLESNLGPSWRSCNPFWLQFGRPRWVQDGASWGQVGAKLGPSWGQVGAKFGQDGTKLGP